MIGILGRKVGMTQVFRKDGRIMPVTVIESGPCSILQIKTKEKDGYNAIQLCFADRFIKEVPVQDPGNYKAGQNIDATQFCPGEFVDIIGTSIGRGFQGGVKRWHWKGGPKSHGSMSHRSPGSIGASAFPSRVFKGHHLPGHMGNRKSTIQNLEVIKVDKDNNLLVVGGSVPGHKNS
ncbi:MAG: 50S ribosomal protein L3, partial [Candidatus Omnitrophica bacterium]|nr:50S ribosomal protein L3 [Candidatus Omnitrophota bacterium]